MKRTMYQAARHTPKRKASGSNPLRNTEYNAENLDVRGFRFFGSLSIVGVGFVKIPPQFYEKGPFYV